MSLEVLAPLAGTVVALTDVPDPVFSRRIVGPGVALDPERADGGEVTVTAPVPGTVAKAHPHAFIVRAATGHAVLVHLGLDTVGLAGRGFRLHVREGDVLAVGDPVVTWDPAGVEAGGLSPLVPVVVLDGQGCDLSPSPEGTRLAVGDVLLTCP